MPVLTTTRGEVKKKHESSLKSQAYCESIALSHREGRFKAPLKSRLDALASNFRRLILINRNLGFFTTGYNYFVQIIPAIIIAPMFIFGQVEFGVITQSTMALATLLGACSLIVTRFQSIPAFYAVTSRLQTLSEAIEKTTRPLHVRFCWRSLRSGSPTKTSRWCPQTSPGRSSGTSISKSIGETDGWLRASGRPLPDVIAFPTGHPGPTVASAFA